ncbi:MAG: molybdopterin converting factor subunit 1 [Pseudomonadota bacterium]
MRLLYFAWVRERIGKAEESVTPPQGVRDVASLLDWLEGRGEGYRAALSQRAAIRVAVAQDHASLRTPVSPDDEVAIFPPVTGG